jgi:hypothetical protein
MSYSRPVRLSRTVRESEELAAASVTRAPRCVMSGVCPT